MKYQHGPEFLDDGKVRFRLWAPSAEDVDLVLKDQIIEMASHANGWYELITRAESEDTYCFRINRELEVPDPASRFQPEGVDGPSQLINQRFQWPEWHGRSWEEAIIYELHIGTFSETGTYKGVEEKLDYLKELGISAIELMPIATFKGERGWGYDGVLPYAPHPAYGTPAVLKELVAAAHTKGLMVFLDVVYNHFGPAGNYLHAYAKQFFTKKYQTPWGAAINFESEKPVRDFFIENALYWLNEYQFDGLRFDAVHAITDQSEKHFLYDLVETIRARLPKDRHIHLILENDKNEARYLGEKNFNAQWNDDIHHAFHVLLTKETSGYYGDYKEKPLKHLGRCLAEGFAYQNDPSPYRKGELRGEISSHLSPTAFINFLQNHDQIGNRALGDRLTNLTSKKQLELAMVILLLSPSIPLLFMGEEWASTIPFLYFCNFEGELADAVREGRRKEFSSFAEFSKPEMREKIPDPNAKATFEASKPDWKSSGDEALAFTKKLLHLRQQHVVPLLKSGWEKSKYQLLAEKVLQVTWHFRNNIHLQLIANFGDSAFTVKPAGSKYIWGKPEKGVAAYSAIFVIGDANE